MMLKVEPSQLWFTNFNCSSQRYNLKDPSFQDTKTDNWENQRCKADETGSKMKINGIKGRSGREVSLQSFFGLSTLSI